MYARNTNDQRHPKRCAPVGWLTLVPGGRRGSVASCRGGGCRRGGCASGVSRERGWRVSCDRPGHVSCGQACVACPGSPRVIAARWRLGRGLKARTGGSRASDKRPRVHVLVAVRNRRRSAFRNAEYRYERTATSINRRTRPRGTGRSGPSGSRTSSSGSARTTGGRPARPGRRRPGRSSRGRSSSGPS